MTTLYILFLIQGAMGAVDTLWHHEFEAALPSRPGARFELALHAAREALYAVVFLGLAWLEWRGAFAVLLAVVMAVEVVVTLTDFIEEDRTRRLAPTERVLHALMAIGFGLTLATLTPILWGWGHAPSALIPVQHGLFSWAMSLVGAGVLAWAVRDTIAALAPARDALGPQGVGRRTGTVLVTGATGFIGRALIAALIAQGRRIVILTRDALAARAQFGPGPLMVESLDDLPEELRLDAIVNLAGASVAGGPWTRGRRRTLPESRIRTTAALTGLVQRLEHRPSTWINASAVGLYGDRGDEALDEAAAPGDCFMAELVGAWEAATRPAEQMGLRVCRLRFGLVLDSGGGVLPLLALPARLGIGAILGGGRQWAPWIARTDVVRLILTAIDESGYRGDINAVAPDLVTQGEMTRRLAAAFGAPQWLHVPGWPLRLGLGEMSDLFLAGQKVLPTRLEALGFVYARPTLESVLARPRRTPPPQPAGASAGRLTVRASSKAAHIGAQSTT